MIYPCDLASLEDGGICLASRKLLTRWYFILPGKLKKGQILLAIAYLYIHNEHDKQIDITFFLLNLIVLYYLLTFYRCFLVFLNISCQFSRKIH